VGPDIEAALAEAERDAEAQREDVPYRWPRGPELGTRHERRVRNFWIALSVTIAVLALLAVWHMVATSG